MALRITRQADYGTRIIHHLARLDPQQRITAKLIANAQGLPSAVTTSVITQLSVAGLVQTTRGFRGGVSLARAPAEISLLEVVEALDGPIVLNECISGLDEGEASENNPLCPTWHEVQTALVKRLREATFDQFC